LSTVSIHRNFIKSQTSHTKATRNSTRAGQQQSVVKKKDSDAGENWKKGGGESYTDAIWYFFSIRSTSGCSQQS